MADKSSKLILDALSRAVLHPEGLPLHGNKTMPGLFAATAAGKQAAQRCKDEGLLRVLRSETRGKSVQETCTITDKGVAHLLSQCSPRDVLEDFVRALEARQSQLNELVATVRQTQLGMEALRLVAQQVLEQMQRQEIPGVQPQQGRTENSWHPIALDQLDRWQKTGATEDCPLSTLYRQLKAACPGLSVGQFHDGLRLLHEQNRIYLHPWTGPLYDLPEPRYALLIGHEVLYYASPRQPQARGELIGVCEVGEPMPFYEYKGPE